MVALAGTAGHSAVPGRHTILHRTHDQPKNRVSPYVHKQYLRRAAIEVGSTFRLIKRFLNDGGSLINPKPSEFQSFLLP